MTKLVFLQDIDIKGSPQVRSDIRDDVINDYADIYKQDKRGMPMIDLVSEDGKVYLLADGLHRLSAMMQLKFKTTTASVVRGGYETALKIALQSNNRHGLRRTHADKRQCIIEAIKQWPTSSNGQIAEICTVDNHTVKTIRDSLEEKGEVKPEPIREAKGGRKIKADRAADKPEPPAKKPTPNDAEVKDELGKVMPVYCTQFWERRIEVKELIEHLSIVSKRLKAAAKEEDLMYAEVNITGALADIDKAWSNIQTAIPFAICTQCHGHPGKDCRLCKGRGLISKFRWDTVVPAEIKNLARIAK